MKTRVTLTKKQIEDALGCAIYGLGLSTSFLRHDDWDFEMTQKQRHESLATDRYYLRTIKMLKKKLEELK